MEILEQFGIEGKLLLVQFINFAILLLVVWKFVLPRLTTLMHDRERQVSDSLKQAEQARKDLEAAEAKYAEERKAARAQAERIIAEAKDAASDTSRKMLDEARREAAALRDRTEASIGQEREALREELRTELAVLTVETTRKVLSDVVKPADQKRLVTAAERYLSKQARPAKSAKPASKRKPAGRKRG
ncbi:MAG: F0F1 ATP synthase subunit B [Patescibacteria group bacterium]